MFDVILTFWILLGIFGILTMTADSRLTPRILIVLSIGGGLLTKGPVIFIHILPVALLYFLWVPAGNLNLKRWYSRLLSSILTGIAMALLWVIPAAILGGDIYREDLLWGQTANRMIASFAHQRPLWWYFPLLPALFFPWFFIKPVWLGMTGLKHDYGKRFVMIWIVSTLLLFSPISGKQIHYLIPMSAAGCMLFARNMADYHSANKVAIKHHYPIAVLYILIGVALIILPWLKLNGDTGHISFGMVGITSIGFIILGGLMRVIRISSMDSMIKATALSTLIALSIFVFSGKNGLFIQHDLSLVSKILKEKQAEDYKILHYGQYEGQYQFLGRLTQPLVVVKDENAVRDYIETSGKVLLITYEKPSKSLDDKDILYQQLYRNKRLIIWKKEGINSVISG